MRFPKSSVAMKKNQTADAPGSLLQGMKMEEHVRNKPMPGLNPVVSVREEYR